MSSHNSIILLIVVLGITTAGVVIMTDESNQFLRQPRTAQKEAVAEIGTLTIVSVVGHNVTSENINAVRFQVQYTGDGEILLNDTLIELRTDDSVADMQYRNGTLTRSVTDGYYTQ